LEKVRIGSTCVRLIDPLLGSNGFDPIHRAPPTQKSEFF
jgi:hypothetical protein